MPYDSGGWTERDHRNFDMKRIDDLSREANTLEARVKELEARIAALESDKSGLEKWANQSVAARTELEARIERVMTFHDNPDNYRNGEPWCVECNTNWPCETASILRGEG
jgi:predicted RNase H-like nuclease (RuvC/YqgF family)